MVEAHQLSPRQRAVVDWIAREALEIGSQRDLEPKDALSEAQDLLILAQLSGSEELSTWALELVDEAQKAVDALPKPPTVGVTFDIGGHADGEEFPDLESASKRISEWVANLDPKSLTGVDSIRVNLEIIEQES
jgi:hypothetical protein